jgi:DNA-binding HxlR family transcriptional regulator
MASTRSQLLAAPDGLRRFAICCRESARKVLTAQLRESEHDGVIRRLVTETVPPRVDYMLSDAGSELIPVMEAMCGWGTKHLGVPTSISRIPANAV